ncbi:phage portal protein [Sphingobacterium sp. InxBP1]|uniref:phage portal protein n=1 Tax=Sphingobacterium sp. InxBP1 TaxID=2870328 RepID=UPI0022431AAF|nr:phage portal protein [Sphingobacterium sp. InxBP1]MCW8314201.1 phage portal protein [Sphingobacterium sp. InxBP1]
MAKEIKVASAAIDPKVIEELGKESTPAYDVKKETDIKEHNIYDEQLRKRKEVKKKVIGSDGKPVMQADGKTPTLTTIYVDPARLPLALQEIIVTRRVAFMNLGKARLYAEPDGNDQERAFNLLQRLRENNKVGYKESEIAKLLNKELQVAKLWYSKEALDASHWGGYSTVTKDFKMQILAPSKGDTLLPVFDANGDLTYFGRQYDRRKSLEELAGDTGGGGDKTVKCFDIYSADRLLKFEQGGSGGSGGGEGGWTLVATVDLPYKKLPIIYYSKDTPIWANVQPLIERLETVISNFADTNDYHASPTLVFKGAAGAEAQEKGESGKAVLLTGDHADAKYVTWDQSVEAVELEIDTLVNFIYSLTQTPNISFEEMKALGDLSGVAFDRVFIDAHLAASNEIDGGYGELLQRSVNLEKALLASMDTGLTAALQELAVTVEVPRFKLDDLDADVDLAIKAKEAGLTSLETAMGISGLVTNVQDEMAKIKAEGSAAGAEGTVVKLKGAG